VHGAAAPVDVCGQLGARERFADAEVDLHDRRRSVA
jgi:hypothetical protein